MSTGDQRIEVGSEIDLAIERALEASALRAGDSGATSAVVVQGSEPSAVEVDGDAGAGDGD